jgi:2'-5' RNA ligase
MLFGGVVATYNLYVSVSRERESTGKQVDDRLRLFVAVDLPEEVREALRDLQADLRARNLGDLRWARPEGIHLTLKFLGDTPAERVPAIRQALKAPAAAAPPLRLALGDVGTVGNRRPRVVWQDVVGDVGPLKELREAVEALFVGMGFPPEEREYSPHLTLARVPQPPPHGTDERIQAALAAVTPPRAEFEVTEFVLMRSILDRTGAVYQRLAAFPLG